MRIPSVPGPRDVWQILERSADSVEQLLAAVPRALTLIGEAETLMAQARRLVDGIEIASASAQSAVDRADTLLESLVPLNDRLVKLLDTLEPPLTTLQPTLERLAETTSPQEVDAMVTLVDHLPALAEKMETDIIPILDSMGSVAPDVHDLLDVSRELNEMLGQIPGMSRMKRRIDDQQEAARRR